MGGVENICLPRPLLTKEGEFFYFDTLIDSLTREGRFFYFDTSIDNLIKGGEGLLPSQLSKKITEQCTTLVGEDAADDFDLMIEAIIVRQVIK